MEYPKDVASFGIEDEHLLGDSLLVHPVTNAGVSSVKVYFPGHDVLWYEIENYQVYQGAGYQTIPVTIEKIPVFQRGGVIVSKKERARRASTAMSKDPYTLIVTLDQQGQAQGRLYADDGQSFDYKTGHYLLIEFTMKGNVLSSKFIGEGRYETSEMIEKIVIAGVANSPSKIETEGRSIEFKYDSQNHVLVLRKPSLYVAKEWQISFV